MKIEFCPINGHVLQIRLTAEIKTDDPTHHILENKDLRALFRLLTDGDGHILADIIDNYEQRPDEASATWERLKRIEERLDELTHPRVTPMLLAEERKDDSFRS